MILPTKHISLENSYLGCGADILLHLEGPQTLSKLWERVKGSPEFSSFSKFILTLDFLYLMGLVDFLDGLLVKRKK